MAQIWATPDAMRGWWGWPERWLSVRKFRCRRRWKIERLFAWLFNFRRLVVRYEYHAENFQGFVHLAAAVILLRHL